MEKSFITMGQISPKFHIWITFIKHLPKSEYEFCPINFKQDGHQSGLHLSVCICGPSNLDIYHSISSKFDIWITCIKFLPKLEYGFFFDD